MDLTFSVFDSHRDVYPKEEKTEWTWKDVLADSWFRPRPIEKRSERTHCFSLVRYRPDAKRGQAGLKAITGLVFDIDNKQDQLTFEELRTWKPLQGMRHFIYPTWSFYERLPRFRVIVPFDQELPMIGINQWRDFYDMHVSLFFPERESSIDPAGRNPAQLWFGFYYKDGWPNGVYDYVFH